MHLSVHAHGLELLQKMRGLFYAQKLSLFKVLADQVGMARDGGLHIEKTVLKALGQWLDGSVGTSVLEIAGISSPGIVNSFDNATYMTRTRRAHQISAAALYIMHHLAYQKYLRSLT